jgi:hypothetical protein
MDAMIPFLPRSLINNPELDDIMYKFNKYKSLGLLSEKTINKINLYINEIDIHNNISTNIITKINYILQLYEPVPEYKYDLNDIMTKIEMLNYNTDTKNKLIENIIIPFISKNNNPNENITLNPTYLLGEPGTGKTKFVNDIAEILGIPLINLSLDSKNSFVTHHRYDSFNESYINPYIQKLHDIIKYKKTKTFLIFIDEFDKKLSVKNYDRYLEIFNSDSSIIRDTYTDISIDLSNYLFITICAGNQKISKVINNIVEKSKKNIRNDDDNNDLKNNLDLDCNPLENRFIVIDFPKIHLDLKTKIVHEYIKKYKEIIDIKAINNLIHEDNFSGVRQLLLKINVYISKCLVRSCFDGTRWAHFVEDKVKVQVPSTRSKQKSRSRSKSR